MPNTSPEGISLLPSTGSAPARAPWSVALFTLIGLIVLAVLAGFWSYYVQVGVWEIWDDEGYVMVTVSRFLQGKALYTDIYSQYGPAYYLFQWLALAPASYHVTHDAVRVQTLFFWGYAAFVAGWTAFRLTRSPVAAFIAHLQTMAILYRITSEPGHPQGLCLFLLATALFAATFFKPDRSRGNAALAFGIGLCIGALIAVKANLGAYFGLAAVLTVFLLSPATRLWNIVTAVAGPVLVVGLVAFLLRSNASLEWVQSLATSVLIGVILLLGVARLVWIRSHGSDSLLCAKPFSVTWILPPAVVGVLVGVAVPVVFVLLRGTAPADIWQGMIGQHLGFDSRFMVALEKSAGAARSGVATSIVAFAIVAGLFVATESQRRRIEVPPANGVAPILASLPILFLAGLRMYLGWQGFERFTVDAEKQYFLSLLPVLWLVLVPRHFARLPDAGAVLTLFLPRVLLVSTAILESLWIYPVAGTQPFLASFLPALLGAVLLADGLTEAGEAVTRLAAARQSLIPNAPPRANPTRFVPTLIAVVTFFFGVNHYREIIAPKVVRYSQTVPLGLPGSRLIRLHPTRVAVLREVTRHLRDNSDTVVLLPGMNSFYFWLERDPPTGLNTTQWMYQLSAEQQQSLVDLYRDPARSGRVVGLYNPNALNIWLDPSRHPADETQKPLFLYVTTQFVPERRIGDFVLLSPRSAPPP